MKNGGSMMNENLGKIKWWNLLTTFFVTFYESLVLIFYVLAVFMALLFRKAALHVRRKA